MTVDNTHTSSPDLEAVRWNQDGLVAAIAQDAKSGRVLMMAWMNRESLRLTLAEGRAVYYSRSRCKLWRKGEESGNRQIIREVALDCDGDTLLLKVEQIGGIACHTGRESCFYRQWQNGQWRSIEPILEDPDDIYR